MDKSQPTKVVKKDENVPETIHFKCSSCGMAEGAQYKGTNPPFSRKIELKYPSYVMKDPFSPPGKGEILVLGGDCVMCQKAVCISKQCSIFYLKTYCLECVRNSIDKFPTELTGKLKLN
uniref:Cysteine-rich DPF motif domain-containing protein 1 n=1 Tax=Pararge aegeria TaxID=116150 RepID=S4NLM1_9NEOP